jgi:hypothetical protein
MWYIGTSLGKCLKSILKGEVSEEQVLFIVTATSCRTYKDFVTVVYTYFHQGNGFVSNPKLYDVEGLSEDEYKGLAQRLWDSGRIHQPNNFSQPWNGPWHAKTSVRNQTWLQVVPTIDNNTPAVVEAYEKYKMLDLLTKNE